MTSKKTGLGDRLWVGGHDLSGDVGSIGTLDGPRGVLDVTGIGQSAVERVPGRSDVRLDFSSWFDDAVGQAHPVLSALPTGNVVILYSNGVSVGAASAGAVVTQIGYGGGRGNDGSLSFGVQGQGSAGVPLEWCQLLTAGEITHASATSSASKDDAAATAQGLAAYLQLGELDSGSVTVSVEHSANDSTWATLVSFTAVADGTEPAAQRITIAGSVDRYLRVTTSGTFSNARLVVAYRRGTAQDDVAY
jgi:hypothetical protein